MSTTENMKSKMLMPEFTIDTITTENGQEIPGIKRMFDIALALKDSVMQWGAPGVGKSQGVIQWNQEKVEEYKQRIANGEKVIPWNPICLGDIGADINVLLLTINECTAGIQSESGCT